MLCFLTSFYWRIRGGAKYSNLSNPGLLKIFQIFRYVPPSSLFKMHPLLRAAFNTERLSDSEQTTEAVGLIFVLLWLLLAFNPFIKDHMETGRSFWKAFRNRQVGWNWRVVKIFQNELADSGIKVFLPVFQEAYIERHFHTYMLPEHSSSLCQSNGQI